MTPPDSARPLPPVVLASGSPRRRELLAWLGVAFEVVAPDVDESIHPGEEPVTYVARLAVDKARAADRDGALVIAADTTVDVDGTILAKPTDADDARRMLTLLAGRTHLVHTGVAARLGDRTEHAVVTTHVTFVPLSPAVIDWYVATGEPTDKAGAYALQGAGGTLVAKVDGSVTNVIGLPLAELTTLAARVGRPLIG